MSEVKFYHDKHLKKPFTLFEDLMLRGADIDLDLEKRKIKVGSLRKRNYHVYLNVSGPEGWKFYAYFVVDGIKYYFKYEKT